MKHSKSNMQLQKAVAMVIYNLSNSEELQQRMDAYGFTHESVEEGRGLLGYAMLMDNTQEQYYDQARRISYQIDQDNDVALEVFRDHVAIAKSAFRKEPIVIQELKIKKIAAGKWTWTDQAMGFYGKSSVYMDKLQQFGATQEAFAQNRAAVEALLELDMQRIKKRGEAEHSTQEKKQKTKELKTWYGKFRKLARMAFGDAPQMLEIFGIEVPSSENGTGKKKRKPASPTDNSELR